MAARSDELRDGVTRAVVALGFGPDARAYDGTLEPRHLERALVAGQAVLVRAGRELATGTGELGPQPLDGVWVCVEPSLRRLRMTPLVAGQVVERAVRAIGLETSEEWCCDAPRCERTRRRYAVVFELEGDDEPRGLWVHEGIGAEDARALAVALSKALGVSVHHHGVALDEAAAVEASPQVAVPSVADAPFEFSALELAQWSLRSEAGRWVVRDRVKAGLRGTLGRELALLFVLVVIALGCGLGGALSLEAGEPERAVIFALCSVVAAIASYAALHIALHTARYQALDSPVFLAYRDRVVPAPWVSRRGEVMLAPEGRYGAALPIAGIGAFTQRSESGEHVLVCESDHGPIELGRFGSEKLALAWQRILTRLLAMSRHAALVLLLFGVALLASACRSNAVSVPPSAPSPASPPAAPPASPPASPPAPSAMPSVVAAAEPVLPHPPVVVPLAMLEDDVPAALATARARNVPVFVEVWAAWCHTCLSMRAFVLPDPAIAALNERVVFAAVDSENAANSPFLERYRVGVWPTLLMLEPKDGSVLGLWEGSASIDELRTFILAAADARGATSDAALAALLEGARAQAAGRCSTAVVNYASALARGGAAWKRRGEAVKGLIYCQKRQRHWKACVETGTAEIATLQGTSAPADVASTLLECAAGLPHGPERMRATELATERLRAWVLSPPAGASTDDRADVLATLASTLRSQGDAAGARALLGRQLTLLEDAAAAAASPEAAATFDYARMNAYLASGNGERAVSMLSERSRQMPDNYEPYARLAQAHAALGRFAEAELAIASALTRVRGPRRIRYLSMQADIVKALGLLAREREVVAELVRTYEALPPTAMANPNNAEGLAEARSRLRRLR